LQSNADLAKKLAALPQHGDFAWQAIIHAKNLAERPFFVQKTLDSADPFNRISLRIPKLRAILAQRSEHPPERHTLDRWAVLFSVVAHDVLDLLVGPARYRPFIARRLDRLLRHEAPDPNRRRLPLPVRAQQGLRATA
jgi:hypothetical protein